MEDRKATFLPPPLGVITRRHLSNAKFRQIGMYGISGRHILVCISQIIPIPIVSLHWGTTKKPGPCWRTLFVFCSHFSVMWMWCLKMNMRNCETVPGAISGRSFHKGGFIQQSQPCIDKYSVWILLIWLLFLRVYSGVCTQIHCTFENNTSINQIYLSGIWDTPMFRNFSVT